MAYCPTGQSVHALAFVDPVFGLCFPAAQSMQALAAGLYLPAKQSAQAIEPASLEVPALHARHSLEFMAATMLLYRPTTQSTHGLDAFTAGLL